MLRGIVQDKLSLFLADLNNTGIATELVGKAVKAAKAREAASKAKKLERQRNKLGGAPHWWASSRAVPGVMQPRTSCLSWRGDSAGGSAKQGRDRKFQAHPAPCAASRSTWRKNDPTK